MNLETAGFHGWFVNHDGQDSLSGDGINVGRFISPFLVLRDIKWTPRVVMTRCDNDSPCCTHSNFNIKGGWLY